jgi:hypothetical protein
LSDIEQIAESARVTIVRACKGDRAQIILLWALLAARRSSGRLPAVIGCPAAQW